MRAGRLSVLVALIVVLPVGGLTPLAYASPPDPSWIRGIYDGADYDDVVLLITSRSGLPRPPCRQISDRSHLLCLSLCAH